MITDAVTGAYLSSFDDIETVVGAGAGITTGTVGIDTSTTAALAFEMADPVRGGYTCDMLNTFGGPSFLK